jgi:hypothetical protein
LAADGADADQSSGAEEIVEAAIVKKWPIAGEPDGLELSKSLRD